MNQIKILEQNPVSYTQKVKDRGFLYSDSLHTKAITSIKSLRIYHSNAFLTKYFVILPSETTIASHHPTNTISCTLEMLCMHQIIQHHYVCASQRGDKTLLVVVFITGCSLQIVEATVTRNLRARPCEQLSPFQPLLGCVTAPKIQSIH